jgi:uncharacterized membrane protein YozB (DUF420 family)
MNVSDLPTVNASLNACSTVLLVAGYRYIRQRRIQAHRACMLAAAAVSAVFLCSYLYYHAQVGSVRFTAQGMIRPIYFAILISHIVLAAAIVPLVPMTLWRALRANLTAHRRLARWTLPLWLYVSVTGVVVYVLLYHLPGTG